MRLATDENLHGDILRGLLHHHPELDIVRIQDTDAYQSDDENLLEWLAKERRILISHDLKTIPQYAYKRIAEGKYLAGVFIIKDRMPIGEAITELVIVIEASTMEEWENRVIVLPF